jgi:hypothetical protein
MTTNDVPAPVPASLEGHTIVPATDFLRVTEQAALASARWVAWRGRRQRPPLRSQFGQRYNRLVKPGKQGLRLR